MQNSCNAFFNCVSGTQKKNFEQTRHHEKYNDSKILTEFCSVYNLGSKLPYAYDYFVTYRFCNTKEITYEYAHNYYKRKCNHL